MTAVLLKAMRDLRRRRLQAAVIFVTTLLAVGTGTMALTLIAQTRDPYQVAFDAQKGAHLKVAFDGRIDPGTIAGTPALIGATAYGGPYRATDVQFQSAGHKYVVTAVGRDNPGGDVGQLRIAAGHWPSSATEIALTRSFADLNHISIGDRLKVVSVPQEPVLTVVAEVVDIDELRADVGGVQHAWVPGTAIALLTAKDASFYLMDYRFASDPTSTQLQASVNTLRASLPPDSVTSSINYIFVRTVFHVSTEILTGVLVAFSVLALAGAVLLVAVAAVIPAFRAGRLKPPVVIANAAAPRGHSGRWLRRLASRARLPRPMVLGLGDAAARPGRAILTLLAIVLGVATVVVALGEARSFNKIYTYEGHVGQVDVVVTKSPALADAQATQLINSQPETMRVVAETTTNINVSGIADPVNTIGFRGDSGALGYLISPGHWFTGPGEVVANRGFVQDAHLNLGDTFTATVHGQALKLRIVGEVFDFTAGPGGHVLMLDWSTITAAGADLTPSVYRVTLKPGSNLDAYVKRLAAAQPDLLDVKANSTGNTAFLSVIAGVLFGIAGIVALIAIAGVFNTMLLSTRERVRDTATLKTLGMSPRQVIGMVATSAGFLALIGGLIAVPAGVALYRMLFDQLSSLGGNITPLAFYDVFAPWELIAIPLGGIIVAVVAAGIPGRWAARINVVEVLHAE